MQPREKVGKLERILFFQRFVFPEDRKVDSLKPGAEPAGQMRTEKLNAVVARNAFPIQNLQNTFASLWSTFGRCEFEKVHAVVVRSTCPSQTNKHTARSHRFWKIATLKKSHRSGAKHIFIELRGGKSARPCGTKRIWK